MGEQIGIFPLLEEAAAALKQSGSFRREIDAAATVQLMQSVLALWLASGRQDIGGMPFSFKEVPAVEINEPKAVFTGSFVLANRRYPFMATFTNNQSEALGLALESLKLGRGEKQRDGLPILNALSEGKVPETPKEVDVNGILRDGAKMALANQGVELTEATFFIKGNSLSASLEGGPIK